MVALILRVLAAFFSEGYAFHDDHFCVTRVAQNWANGLPHWLETGTPPKHSMLYAGVNAGIVWFVDLFGTQDPYVKTTALRLAHAVYSMLIVLLCYRITLLLSDEKKAQLVGWIIALLWFMPFMGVRFLVEMVCIPPVLGGFYLLIKQYTNKDSDIWVWLIAGALFALAFAIRYHTILFAGGLGLVLLYRRQWLGSLLFTLGFLVSGFATIGLIDLIFFDYPFHSIVEYYAHNSANATKYISGSPFKFTLTTFGFLIPPVSIFLMVGYIRSFKIEPMMFVAVLVFFVFHSSFPNQQERFILPMFPLLIILGVLGWKSLSKDSRFWNKYSMINNVSWKFFWIINIIGVLFMSFTFSKKDRVAPLHYLSTKDDVRAVIVENERSVKQVPVFYMGENATDFNEWGKGVIGIEKMIEEGTIEDDRFEVVFSLGKEKSIDALRKEFKQASKIPNYIIFQGTNELDNRKQRVQGLFPNKQLIFEAEIDPSALDKILHFFNPRVHRDQTATIFKID